MPRDPYVTASMNNRPTIAEVDEALAACERILTKRRTVTKRARPSQPVSVTMPTTAQELCQLLPLIEDAARRVGLFRTAAKLNQAVNESGFECAEQLRKR